MQQLADSILLLVKDKLEREDETDAWRWFRGIDDRWRRIDRSRVVVIGPIPTPVTLVIPAALVTPVALVMPVALAMPATFLLKIPPVISAKGRPGAYTDN